MERCWNNYQFINVLIGWKQFYGLKANYYPYKQSELFSFLTAQYHKNFIHKRVKSFNLKIQKNHINSIEIKT